MDGLKCSRCDCELELIEVAAEYLGHRFAEKIPGCPKCGQVYISEEFANTKIADVESTLEIK